MTRTIIDHARFVVTVDDDSRILQDATIVIEDGIIVSVGPPAVPATSDIHLDARERLVLPGLVNLHTHLPMALLRGIAEGVDLQGFLQRVWAAEGAVMDAETVELGAQLGALESLLAGATTQLDMYFHHEAAHRGAVSVGARHVVGPTFFEGPGPDGFEWDERIEFLRAWPEQLAAIGGPEVPISAMPHATYTVTPEHLKEVGALLAQVSQGRRAVLTTHVSENEAENADVLARYGATPTGILAQQGWFDLDLPIVFGHGVHLSAQDRVTIAGGAATVAHCPGSNLKLASGALNWESCRADDLALGLGTDGCSSSNDLDPWFAMRQAALLARLTAEDPTAGAARDIVRAATMGGATALGMGDLIGSIEVGKRADLVLLDLSAPHLTPVLDVEALLVFAAGRGDVHDVFVDGVPVVRSRRSTMIDTADLLSRASRRAAAIPPFPAA